MMALIRLHQWLIPAAAFVAITVASTAPAQAKVRSNTQVRLPDNTYLGDINGDGNDDFVYVRGGAIYVTSTDYWDSKILYSVLSSSSQIKRVFTGDFQGSGADQVCAIHTDGLLSCWAASWDRTTMDWWFTEWSFIGDDEEVIVGNFDGDGKDDILVYKPSTGQLRHFLPGTPGSFDENPNFQPGNAAPQNMINKKIYAGEFGQAVGQTDLLVYDQANGQIARLDSVNWGSISPTFWWAFTTSPGFLGFETLAVANIEGLDQDDVVLRDVLNGGYRFFRLEWDYAHGNLVRINQDPGQLPIRPSSMGTAYWLRNRGWYDTSSKRDDQMFWQTTNRTWSNVHAREWDGAHYYWWYFTKPPLERIDGDANGDQRTDLALQGNQRWGTIPLATSNADGTFTETNLGNSDPGMYFTSWASTPGAKLVRGDFDGDGMSDLALVGGYGWGSVPVAFSKGNGTYRVTNQSVANFPAWASKANVKVVTGDFDNDGKSDIALVGEVGRHSIPIAYSRGDGNFDVIDVPQGSFADLASFRDFNRTPQVWPKVVAADFNDDGNCDLALVGGMDFTGVPVAFSSGRGAFSFQNLALDGGASDTSSFQSRAKEPGTQVVAGDFDGNGLPDVALVGGSGEQTDIYFALNYYGNGQFSVSPYTSVQAPDFSQWAREPGVKAVSGYFNDDTVADIALVGGVGWKSVRLAMSNYGLSFRSTNVASDFGGYAAQPHVWPASNVAGMARRTARSLDQDLDRLGDISLTGGVGWGSMPVAFSRANGDFKITNNGIDGQWASFAAHNYVSVLAGDYDGDGREDVALASPTGYPQMVAFANGNGTFQVHKHGTSLGDPTAPRVVAGDFTGDGKTDIMAIGGLLPSDRTQFYNSSTLYYSYGDGEFLSYGFGAMAEELSRYVNQQPSGAQIVAGDFNGDGAADLAVTGGITMDWVHVYFSTGFGQFQRASFQNTAIRIQITGGSKMVAGDFDGDGLDDLYFLGGGGTGLTVGFSQGNGAFTAKELAAPNAMTATMGTMAGNFKDWSRSYYMRPVVGDFDGDGSSDLALTGGRDWKSVPVAFSTRRTDVAAPWLVHNPPITDFPVFAAAPGALPAAEDPTNTVDTAKPPPPSADPPSTIPTITDPYIVSASNHLLRGWVDMPRNMPVVYNNAGWTFVFDICHDNTEDFDLSIGRILVRETYLGIGNQWHVFDWWAKGYETYDDGTASNYRSVDYYAGDSYPLPETDYSRQPYTLHSIAARGCKRMFVERPGGQGPGIWFFDFFIDDVEPVAGDPKAASIMLTCPQNYDLSCTVNRF